MIETNDSLGGRLSLLNPASLTDAQKALYDKLQDTWVRVADEGDVQATTGDGRLIGPFNPFLLHPEVTEKLSDFQATEASCTTLTPSVREAVVLITGSVWRADFELYAQVSVAKRVQLPGAAAAALARGEIPDDLGHDEKIAARVARALMTRRRVDDDLYREAERLFGAIGLYDIIAVMGVYETVCSMLALFEVPAPS